MKQRIAAGGLVFDGNRLLLVNHRKANIYDFWVAPGGGVMDTESLEEAVVREVKEETGLDVKTERLLYIEEFWQPEQREVKFWYLCELKSGEIDTSAEEATREYIVDAKFMYKEEILKNIVFPEAVQNRIWDDVKNENPGPFYLGLRKMKFY